MVRVAKYASQQEAPPAVRDINHRTILTTTPQGVTVFHVGPDAPAYLESENVVLTAPRSQVARSLLELSFADAAVRCGFDVSIHHVGGAVYRDTATSSRPSVFLAREGFSFRAFSFLEPEREEVRWGLVLNYQTGQRFRIDLSDPVLRQLALNKRVVRVGDSSDVEGTGLLSSVEEDHILVAHRDGTTTVERPSDWMPQCRKDLLLEYIALTENRAAASEVSSALQHESMALTRGRINVALARDQVTRIQKLARETNLTHFRVLSVEGGPLARLSLDPLTVEAQ